MSLKVRGIGATKMALERTSERVFRYQLNYLREVSEKIRQRAREYAPVLEGPLEESIVVEEDRLSNNRIAVFIGVDPDLLGDGYQVKGFRYDIHTHELMDSPYGEGAVRRGELTQAKGPNAGGKYLERAFRDFEDEIYREMAAITERGIR